MSLQYLIYSVVFQVCYFSSIILASAVVDRQATFDICRFSSTGEWRLEREPRTHITALRNSANDSLHRIHAITAEIIIIIIEIIINTEHSCLSALLFLMPLSLFCMLSSPFVYYVLSCIIINTQHQTTSQTTIVETT